MIARSKGKTLSQEEINASIHWKTPTRKKRTFDMAGAENQNNEMEEMCRQFADLQARQDEIERRAHNQVVAPWPAIEDEYMRMTDRHKNASFEGGIDANKFQLF